MKNFLIWLRWKLFVSIERATCDYMSGASMHENYSQFLSKHNHANWGILKRKHPKIYKQMRRDFMWRFLVKGER